MSLTFNQKIEVVKFSEEGILEAMIGQKLGLLHETINKFLNTNAKFFSSVQFSRSVLSDTLWCHGLQQTRPPCPSPTPGVYPNSCPLSRWCHSAISSSVVPFSSCLQSFPASGSLQMSQVFTSGGQSIGVSASISVFPMNTQDWSPLGWTVRKHLTGEFLCDVMDLSGNLWPLLIPE